MTDEDAADLVRLCHKLMDQRGQMGSLPAWKIVLLARESWWFIKEDVSLKHLSLHVRHFSRTKPGNEMWSKVFSTLPVRAYSGLGNEQVNWGWTEPAGLILEELRRFLILDELAGT